MFFASALHRKRLLICHKSWSFLRFRNKVKKAVCKASKERPNYCPQSVLHCGQRYRFDIFTEIKEYHLKKQYLNFYSKIEIQWFFFHYNERFDPLNYGVRHQTTTFTLGCFCVLRKQGPFPLLTYWISLKGSKL